MKKQHKMRNEHGRTNRVELHCCTGANEWKGTFGNVEAVGQAYEEGLPAIAIVDHCSVQNYSAAARTAQRLKWGTRESDRDIKLIWGVEVEFYSNNDAGYAKIVDKNESYKTYSAVLLAKNRRGLKNINRIISYYLMAQGNEGMITRSAIEWFREGLLVGASAEGGELTNGIAMGATTKQLKRIASFYDYLEINPYVSTQNHNIKAVEIGDMAGVPTVAVAHIFNDYDKKQRRIITTNEMLKELSYLGDRAFEVVVTNSTAIANKTEDISPIPEGKYYPSVKDAGKIIRQLCYEKARALYGDILPHTVRHRLEKELEIIIGNGEDSIYLLNREIVQDALKDNDPVGYKGMIGGSLVSYLIGLTPVNPLPPHYVCPVCKSFHEAGDAESWAVGEDLPDRLCPDCSVIMNKHGFNIPGETLFGLRGDRFPDIDITVPLDYQNKEKKVVRNLLKGCQSIKAGKITSVGGRCATEADEYGLFVIPYLKDIEDFTPFQFGHNAAGERCIVTHHDWRCLDLALLKIDVVGDKSLQLLKELSEKTGVEIENIPLSDEKTIRSISSREELGIYVDGYILNSGTYGIPDYDNELFRDIVDCVRPETLSELIKCYGLSWGTDTWNEKIRSLVLEKETSIGNVVSSREDIYTSLIHRGLDPAHAYKAMELVRKGRELSEQQLLELKQAGLPEWWIHSLQSAKFFSIRAQDVIRTIIGIKLAWFKTYYPTVFYNVWLQNNEYYNSHKSDFEKLDMNSLGCLIKDARKERSDSEVHNKKEGLTVYQILYEMSARVL